MLQPFFASVRNKPNWHVLCMLRSKYLHESFPPKLEDTLYTTLIKYNLRLFLTQETVKTCSKHIFEKMGSVRLRACLWNIEWLWQAFRSKNPQSLPCPSFCLSFIQFPFSPNFASWSGFICTYKKMSFFVINFPGGSFCFRRSNSQISLL